MKRALKEITESLIEGDPRRVQELVKSYLDEGMPARQILFEGLIEGMRVIGKKFNSGDMFLPEIVIAGRAMQKGMDVLAPILIKHNVQPVATILLGTVCGDLHDIGKNLVGLMFRGAGFRVIDIGVDVSQEKFVDAVRQYTPNLVGLSALLTTTMPYMKTVIEAIDRAGLRKNVKVIVGGAPVTEKFSSQAGADGYASNAASAVEEAKTLLDIQ